MAKHGIADGLSKNCITFLQYHIYIICAVLRNNKFAVSKVAYTPTESSLVQSSPVRLQSQGVFKPTELSPIKSVRVPVGFQYSLNSAQVKQSTAMENMLVLHAIMWRRWRRHKRRNIWVRPINIKRPEFGIFSHLYLDLLKGE